MSIDKIKEIALPVLIIILGIVVAFHFLFPKVITKTETKVEIREVIRYITSNSTITGATSATLTPGGTAVSGSNLTITNATTITQHSDTTITDKIKTKYSETAIIAGLEGFGIVKDYGGFINFKTDAYEFGISYAVIRKEFDLRAGMAVLSW